jgi:UDP-N-acetylglucosamine--N-acetylmuramyl-(pentapeptide) pyrophosphoryl-undecaprenol N-acetylglucosamine transferase
MKKPISKTRILFVGGGTGGHFYPLIAIAEVLRAQKCDADLYFAGPERYDADVLSSLDIHYVYISAGKKRRYASFLNVLDSFKILFGTLLAIVRLYIIYPDVVMSKGSYTSVPVVLAAGFLRIPIIIHESDAVMGAANKLGKRFADHVVITYDELASISHKSIYKLGIPTRKVLLQNPTDQAISRFNLDPNRPVIFIIGGSQGAERINELVLESLDELLVDFSIIHQTGKQLFELCNASAQSLLKDSELLAHYHPYPFLTGEEMNDAYHLASVVVSRAGSTSIYEIALHGKPSILIPIPEEISHDQRSNAYAYARIGGGSVMEEKNLTDGLLRAEIDRIMQDTALYERMSEAAQSFAKTDAAEQVANLLTQTAKTH